MTAEAVVLNKSAVAMAADSAVTISGGSSGMLKTFDTANKLFELIKRRPVGVMTYANADMNGVPWETLIKSYRQERAAECFDKLDEYVIDFFSFLQSSDDLLSEESEQHCFQSLAYEQVLLISSLWKSSLPTCMTSTGKLVMNRARKALVDSVEEVFKEMESKEDAPWMDELSVDDLADKFGSQAKDLVSDRFGRFGLRQKDERRIRDLLLLSCCKRMSSRAESGLVVAGFGAKEPFPTVWSGTIRGRLAGKLLFDDMAAFHVSQKQAGSIFTYAQDQHAWGWLTGIDSRVRTEVITYWERQIRNSRRIMRELLKQTHKRLSDKTVKEIADAHQALLRVEFQEFLEHMQTHEDTAFRSPIFDSVPFLPREELALIAESLVNVTSIRQRVSVQSAQTVGGEIDLGLISPGDGFVWIKRKHYFTPELNPGWVANNGGSAPSPTNQPTSDTGEAP